jgi:hypothetical protein
MVWIKALLGVIGIGGDYLKAKATLKQTKVESQTRVIEATVDHDNAWEQLHAEGSQTSWKDEFWTIVFAVPLVLGFLQFKNFDGPSIAKAGFDSFAGMPSWYQYTLVTIVLASFGIRNKEAIGKMLGGVKVPFIKK